MADFMIGTSILETADTRQIQEAGIGWVRQSFGLPFEDRVGGMVSREYRKSKAWAQRLRAAGLRIMGITPLPGIGTMKPDAQGGLKLTWRNFLPDWCGALGSEEYLKTYEAVCTWLARDLKGLVPAWQIANELDIEQFGGPLNARQACDLIARAARGLKSTDPSLVVGHNPAGGGPHTSYFFGYLYGRGDGLLDYCGIDGYYGTWIAGGPQDWPAQVAQLHALTGKPIFINEWGFSSAGNIMTAEEIASGAPVCQLRKWRHGWGRGHTPEGQADFVRETFEVLRPLRDILMGLFFYRWEDQERCWQCGSAECPAETAWGLVDRQERPKPSFHAFKEAVRRLRG